MTLNKSNLNWIEEAYKYIGQKEIAGIKSNSWILSLWQLKDKWLGTDDSKVPWCGAFVNYVLTNCGYSTIKTYYRARDWAKWGQSLPKPCAGCIVVFERTGGGHVGFLLGQDKSGNLLVLGGNQGDSVNIAAFDPNRAIAYRWPNEKPAPQKFYLPITTAKVKLSTNEA